MSLDRATVIRIANLAKIHIDDSEIDIFTRELSQILNWVEQLNEVDVKNVKPMTGVSGMSLREREDEVLDGGYADKIVKNSKEKKKNSFSVPKVIE
ncbi:MAG: Glutamyl-tRNA(Gln) amidotransferase subunit C [Alphaproteobacteria bacterium MarineAlpha9_Bin1]|nr:MAG: Glutamyl-tRNA(Gln) amidotransferase subunit C [Alphaproteobacteria bacterium MarineAlpha9_Bin1]